MYRRDLEGRTIGSGRSLASPEKRLPSDGNIEKYITVCTILYVY